MVRKRRNATKARAQPRPGQLLGRLQAGEAAQVLRVLLARHPGMAAEAERLAKSVVTDVDVEAIAEDVEQAVLDLDLDDLNARAGRKRWGYVEPTEAAWELLEEAVAPYVDEMRRRIELGLEAAAVAACQAIVLGLYRCQGQATDRVIGWAEDSPAEIAGEVVATLARVSACEAPAHMATADRVQGAGAGVGGPHRTFRADVGMSNRIGKAGSRFFSEPPVNRGDRECD